MQHGDSTSGTVNPGGTPPKQRRPRFVVLVVAVVLLVLTFAIGESCGASWERSLWEPKYAELEDKYTELHTENTRISDDNLRYLNQYQEYLRMRMEVNRRLGDTCDDRKTFVTPTDPSVASRVLAITGGFSSDPSEQWSDYEALYEWVRTNIKYSYDSRVPMLPAIPSASLLSWQKDYFRIPSETLEDETGDCEDMAILLASMIMNYTQSRYACWVILWHSQDSGHAAVAMPVAGGNLTILDPAGNQIIGPGGHQSISATTTQWLGKWPSESGIYVSGIFSDTECIEFANTAEFVTWASSRA
jgi:hypothetical protein